MTLRRLVFGAPLKLQLPRTGAGRAESSVRLVIGSCYEALSFVLCREVRSFGEIDEGGLREMLERYY